MRNKLIYFYAVIIILLFFCVLCTTQVTIGWISVITSFGRPVKVISEPGLHLKWPYPLHKVEKIDSRLALLQPKPSEFLTSDKKNLILENCICYRISDPIAYLKTVRNKTGLELRLSDLLASHTGLLLGVRELSELINVDSSKMKFGELNDELTNLMREDSKDLGVKVEKVFIKRIMLPYQNLLAVYDRMRAERDRIAKKYLAEGEEQAIEIRAEADKISRTIIAEAEMKAAVIKGEAEAEAMKVYGQAYQQNREFYRRRALTISVNRLMMQPSRIV